MDFVQSQKHPLLQRRRNSISASVVAIPAKLTAFDSNNNNNQVLTSVKPDLHSYSSLRDILPLIDVNSPKPNSNLPVPDICIRDHLVKQAAWAYLQPMSTAPDSAGENFFGRLWTGIAAVVYFFCRE